MLGVADAWVLHRCTQLLRTRAVLQLHCMHSDSNKHGGQLSGASCRLTSMTSCELLHMMLDVVVPSYCFLPLPSNAVGRRCALPCTLLCIHAVMKAHPRNEGSSSPFAAGGVQQVGCASSVHVNVHACAFGFKCSFPAWRAMMVS
jgi:hypothetical protein